MTKLLAIAAGGAIGALLRYWTSVAVHSRLGAGFPYGTLAVNVIGSLLMGFLYIWLIDRMAAGPTLRAFLLIGVLGAFTTFSTFSMDVVLLSERGAFGLAFLYVLSSVVLSIAAFFAAMSLFRSLLI